MKRLNLREACSRVFCQLSAMLLLALSVVAASFTATAQLAEVVVRIEVTDRSEATIAEAAREALQQTLLLRSGDRDLLADPTISAALDDARSLSTPNRRGEISTVDHLKQDQHSRRRSRRARVKNLPKISAIPSHAERAPCS